MEKIIIHIKDINNFGGFTNEKQWAFLDTIIN